MCYEIGDCLYFGCWKQAGHFLFLPGGASAWKATGDQPVYYLDPNGSRRHIDSTLAPKRLGGSIVWGGQVSEEADRSLWSRINYKAEEFPQGQYLLHHLNNGYSIIQWWDRCQGDTRGACNSSILLKGLHTSEELVAAAKLHFPHALENLKRGGFELVEVKK